jgi:threonine dehydrogenase-like Zn-dependent dehydrogenase
MPQPSEIRMKAIGYLKALPILDPESLIDLDLPVPEPGPRDLRVAVKAVSVNPVDVKQRAVAAPPAGQARVLGFDAAGIVDTVGAEVSLFKPGDAVFYAGAINRPGSNSEFQLVDERIAGRKPASLPFDEAAALPLTAITAWELLFDRLGVTHGAAGGTLLIVNGAGGVGSILTQLARQLTGLTVVATASRPETADWCLTMGAHHVIDHTKPLDEGLRAIGIRQVEYVAGLTASHRAAGQAGADRRSRNLRHRAVQAQMHLGSLGGDVRPLPVPDPRHDRAAPAAERGVALGGCRRAAEHDDGKCRTHRRRRTEARACGRGKRPEHRQDGADGVLIPIVRRD